MLQGTSATGRLVAALTLNDWLWLAAKQLNAQEEEEQQQQQQQQQQQAAAAVQVKAEPGEPVATAAAEQEEEEAAARERLLSTSTAARSAALAALVPAELPDACLALLASATPAAPCPPGAEPYSEAAGAYAAMRRGVTAALDAIIKVRGLGGFSSGWGSWAGSAGCTVLGITPACSPRAPQAASPNPSHSPPTPCCHVTRCRLAPQAGGQLTIPPGASLDTLTPAASLQLLSAPGAAAPATAAARAAAVAAIQQLQALEAHLHGSCCLALASAVSASGELPEKLTPVLGGLMQSLRREPVAALQRVGASALANLLLACVPRRPCPNDKVVKNLAAMACGDPAETPKASDPAW
jgi:hypothetical protein